MNAPITIFTPSDADEENTNAQNLSVKEIVSRLPVDQFRVTMIYEGKPDSRLAARKNTELIRWREHGNTVRLLKRCLFPPPDIYFFPRSGPLDRAFFEIRKRFPVRTSLVSYIVTGVNETLWCGLLTRSILEADEVCANSKLLARTIEDRFHRDPTVVCDGVDRRFFYPPGEKSGHPPVVLYAGSFLPSKRAEAVIEQASRLPWVQFRLAGHGSTEKYCRAICQQQALANVSFLGHLTQTQLGEEMRRADVFLFPSILEGNPQVLLQAAACGLPCIAMDLYQSEYVVSGETGFLVRNDQELAHRLGVLIGNCELRRTMSEAAVKHSWKFDWDKIADQWAEIFLRAARAGRTPSHRCAAAS